MQMARIAAQVGPIGGLRYSQRPVAILNIPMTDSKMPLPLACPRCGFRIFNRRYPKCESCGQLLPAGLVYSATELAALQKAQEDEASRARSLHGRPAGDAGGSTGFVWGIGDAGGGNDCGVGGGDCGGGD
jgi:hypothetical protein